jgi:hypothetical protein
MYLLHMHQNYTDQHHYRTSAAPPLRPLRAYPAPLRQRDFGARELLALVALAVAGDMLFAQYTALAEALALLLTPIVLWISAPKKVASTRLLALAVLAALLALRAAYSPSLAVTVCGVLVIAALSQAMRTRSLQVPEFAIALIATMAFAVRRCAAVVRGVGVALRITDLGARAAAAGISLAVVAGFTLLLAFANPELGSMVTAVFNWTLAHIPSWTRLATWCVSLLAGALLLRPAIRKFVPAATAASTVVASPMRQRVARHTLLGLNSLLSNHCPLLLGGAAALSSLGSARKTPSFTASPA